MGFDDAAEKVSIPFKTTDRPLDEYQKRGHFDILKLPQGAVIGNIGSGTLQVFEGQVRSVRPDIKVLSVDAGLLTDKQIIENTKGEKIELPVEERIANLANKPSTVVALGQELPVRDNFFDLVVDINGPAQYAKDLESYKKYLGEVMRAIKPGGEFHIANLWFGDPIPGNKESLQKSRELATKVFDEMGLKAELFENEVGVFEEYYGKKDVPDIRIGATIVKDR